MKKKVGLVLAGALALSTLPFNVFAASENEVSNLFVNANDVSYITVPATSTTATTYADLIASENNADLLAVYRANEAKLIATDGTPVTVQTGYYDAMTGNQLVVANDGTGVLTVMFDATTKVSPAPKMTFKMLTELSAGEKFEITLTNGEWSKDADLYLPTVGGIVAGFDADLRDDNTIRLTATTSVPAGSTFSIPFIADLEGGKAITIEVKGGTSAITNGTYALTNQVEGNVSMEGDNGVLTITEDMPGSLNPTENLYIQIRGSKAKWKDGATVQFGAEPDFGITSSSAVITETMEESLADLESNLPVNGSEFYDRTLVLDVPGTPNTSGFSADLEIDLSRALNLTDRDFEGQVELVVWGAGIDSDEKQTVTILDLEGDVEVTLDLDDEENVEQLTSGRTGEEASKFVIKEKVDGSLRDDRYIKFELSEGATWDTIGTTVEVSDANVTGKFNLTPDVEDENIAYLDKDTVIFEPDALNEITIDPVINLDATTTGDVTVTISGPGMSSEETEVTIAQTKSPITIDTEITHIKAGFTNFPTSDIVIKENYAGALSSGEYRIYADIEGIEGLKIGGVDDEEVIGTNNLEANVDLEDNEILFDITSESTDEAGVIKITGVEIYADSTVPTSKEAFELTLEGLEGTSDLEAGYGYEFDYVTTGNIEDETTPGVSSSQNLNKNVEITLGSTAYSVDGEYTGELVAAPYVSNSGSVMVSTRALSTALGIPNEDIMWHQASQTVTIKVSDDRVAQFKVGSDLCTINGIQYPIQSASGQTDVVEVRNGYTFLPLRFLGEKVFNVKVEWDTKTQTATFNPTNSMM